MSQTTSPLGAFEVLVNKPGRRGIVCLGQPSVRRGQTPPEDDSFLFKGAHLYDRNLPENHWVRTGIMTELVEDACYLTLQVPWETRKSLVAQPSSIDRVVEPLLSGLAKTASKQGMPKSDFYVIAGYLLPNPNMSKIPHFFSHNQPFYSMVYASAQNDKALSDKPRRLSLSTLILLGASDLVRETSLICESLLEGCAADIQKDSERQFHSELLNRQEVLQGLLSYINGRMQPLAL